MERIARARAFPWLIVLLIAILTLFVSALQAGGLHGGNVNFSGKLPVPSCLGDDETFSRAQFLIESFLPPVLMLRSRSISVAHEVFTVASQVLSLCHYDPDTGGNKRGAPDSKENCTAACYNCLMSDRNQMDHEHLDREAIFKLLNDLKRSGVNASPRETTRAEHLRKLMRLTQSSLEEEWPGH